MNQNPEQLARDRIDAMLIASGWIIQNKKKVDLYAGDGIAVREYQTDAGPVDYVLFVDKKPVGIVEAKREEGVHLTVHEDQSKDYADSKLKYLNNDPLPFVYESTGTLTRFTDYHDPKPRSRPVFSFHRPETFREWLKWSKTLRGRRHDLPELNTNGLRDCQIAAITNPEKSFKTARPKALIQMVTGLDKTFTAINFIYRLLKPPVRPKRILFLVDTKNLGEQAGQEFMTFQPNDDNRKFTELYGVHRLKSSFIPTDNHVYISTIQRMYSGRKGKELKESTEEENPAESKWQGKEAMPVEYNEKIPIEFFDFVVVDERHRSIYNLWKQVLDYFDAFHVGHMATPEKRSFGHFEKNIVSGYGYKKAVEDGVLVPYNVFEIETKITKGGAKVSMGECIGHMEKLTRKKFWNQLNEDLEYSSKRLDDKVVNHNQVRLIICMLKEQLPQMFPERYLSNNKGELEFEVPKMLFFAKDDSHADDIINIVREEFAEGNDFYRKITCRTEKPKDVLTAFRTGYYPRIAVTLDMIATCTNIQLLEVLLFMRDVKGLSYYEQMKRRGTRTCSLDELRSTGKPAAKYTKDHFVFSDAIGVEKSHKTNSRQLEKKPGLSLKEVLEEVNMSSATTHQKGSNAIFLNTLN